VAALSVVWAWAAAAEMFVLGPVLAPQPAMAPQRKRAKHAALVPTGAMGLETVPAAKEPLASTGKNAFKACASAPQPRVPTDVATRESAKTL
jgi:hypothetical protein